MNKASDKAGERLVSELKLTKVFPEYNSASIDKISNDINVIYQHMVDKVTTIQSNDLPQTDPDAVSAAFDTLRIERNKRAVYIYLNERCKRLQKYFWQNGPELYDHVKKDLDHNEVEYLANYSKLIKDYQNNDTLKCKFEYVIFVEQFEEIFMLIIN